MSKEKQNKQQQKKPPPNKTYPKPEIVDAIIHLLQTDHKAIERMIAIMTGQKLTSIRERQPGRKKRYGADKYRKIKQIHKNT